MFDMQRLNPSGGYTSRERVRLVAHLVSFILVQLFALGLVVAGVLSPDLYAGPKGASVEHGDVQVDRPTEELTEIHQQSREAIVEYDSFDVNPTETVRFDQPGAEARILNRIRSENPTEIRGALEANGQVFLTNPSGILFGPNSTVYVGKLYAAAGYLSNKNFLNGRNQFEDLEGTVENLGTLQGSSVHLVGKHVANIGTIHAEQGVITMSSGQDVLLGTRAGHVFVKIEDAGGSGARDGVGVQNQGTVDAENGTVRMSAGDLYATSIFNDGGTVKGTDIKLDGTDGTTLVSGVLDASTDIPGEQGGSVRLVGEEVGVFDAEISADGAAGGGRINVGGSKKGNGPLPNAEHTFVGSKVDVSADATKDGDGGQVIVWSEGTTTSHGTISATGGPDGGDGGFVEVSGDALDTSVSLVDVSAQTDDSGTALFDPLNIVIEGGTNDGDDNGTGNDSALFEDGGNQTLNFGDDASSDFTVYESELEGTGSSITLEARKSISASGTFGNTDVLLQQDVDLTLRTRNDGATSDGEGNIDLTTSDHGTNLEFTTQGTGAFTVDAGTANDLTSDVLLPEITTAGGNVSVTSHTGSIHVTSSINAGSGTVDFEGSPLNLSADVTAGGVSGMNVDEVNVLASSADIQDGVDAVNTGGTVNVASGTFDGPIQVNKAIGLIGAGPDVTTIRNTGGSNDIDNLITLGASDNPELPGLTFEGFTLQPDQDLDALNNFGDRLHLIQLQASGTGTDPIVIRNNHLLAGADDDAIGVQLIGGHGHFDVRTNTMAGNGTGDSVNMAYGMFLNGGHDATIENNTIDTVQYSGIALGKGQSRTDPKQTEAAQFMTISENTITNAATNRSFDGGNSVWDAGIHMDDISHDIQFVNNVVDGVDGYGLAFHDRQDPSGTPGEDLSGVSVRENTISNATTENTSTAGAAVFVPSGVDASPLTIRGNDLSGNDLGADHRGGGTLDAPANWWGTDTPSNISPRVNGSVDYNPILPSGVDTDDPRSGFQGDRSRLTVHTLGKEVSSGRIQSGVNTVVPGGTLDIRPGTYSHPVTIDKDVSIIGPNAGVNPNTESRGTEATVTTPGKSAIEITDHAELAMNGMRFDDVAKFIRTGDTDTNSPSGWGSVDLRNNIFNNASSSTQFRFRDDPGATFDFHQNLVSNSANDSGGSFDGFTNGLRIRGINRTSSGEGPVKVNITNNVWKDNAGWAIAPNNITGTLSNNTIHDPTPGGGAGALDNQWGLLLATGNRSKNFSTNLTVTRNTFKNLAGAAMSLDFNFYGKLNATQNIFQNIASNNFTEGAFFVDDDTDVFISSVTVKENRFAGNDASIVNRSHNDTTLNAPVNWWNSTEDVVIENDRLTGPVDFTPYLDSGTDRDGSTPGFQGNFSVLHVTSRGRQTGDRSRLEEGVDRVADPGLLKPHSIFDKDMDLLVIGARLWGVNLVRSTSMPYMSGQQPSSRSATSESQAFANQLKMPRIQPDDLMFSGLDRVTDNAGDGDLGPVHDGIVDYQTDNESIWGFLKRITEQE